MLFEPLRRHARHLFERARLFKQVRRARNDLQLFFTPSRRLTRAANGITFCRTPRGEGRTAVSLLTSSAVTALNKGDDFGWNDWAIALRLNPIAVSRRLARFSSVSRLLPPTCLVDGVKRPSMAGQGLCVFYVVQARNRFFTAGAADISRWRQPPESPSLLPLRPGRGAGP